MKHKRFFLRWFLLAGLIVVFSTSILKAEELKGKFTLPFDTYWSGVLLPAGEYHFVIDPISGGVQLRTPAGKGAGYRVIAFTEALKTPAKSQLVITRREKRAMVQILYLADLKTAYHFKVPERYEVSSRILMSSSGPAGIEHITVDTSGK